MVVAVVAAAPVVRFVPRGHVVSVRELAVPLVGAAEPCMHSSGNRRLLEANKLTLFEVRQCEAAVAARCRSQRKRPKSAAMPPRAQRRGKRETHGQYSTARQYDHLPSWCSEGRRYTKEHSNTATTRRERKGENSRGTLPPTAAQPHQCSPRSLPTVLVVAADHVLGVAVPRLRGTSRRRTGPRSGSGSGSGPRPLARPVAARRAGGIEAAVATTGAPRAAVVGGSGS